MGLRLTLIKAPDNVAGNELGTGVHTFDESGGTLGRSASNSWVLPDPDRFLSSCHCEIVCEQGQFYLVDLSTNGTFVNGSPEPLGKGMRTPLADGDTFEVGDYRFSVSLDSGEGSVSDSPSSGTFSNDPFVADLDQGFSAPPLSDGFADSPFEDEFFNASPMPETRDPLALLDRAQGHHELPMNDAPFGEPASPFDNGTAVNHTPGLDEALTWPETTTQNLIPDDWEDDLLGSPEPGIEKDELFRPQLQPATPFSNPEPQSPPAPFENPAAIVSDSPFGPADYTPQQVPVPEPKPRRVEQPVPIPRPAANHRAARQPVDAESHGFIRALGMDPEAMSAEQREAINQMGGEMLRELVEGVMQLLRSRSTIKNEFRMNVTTIEPFENNPFKFSVGVDDALENIFIKKGKAYKEPLEAMRECFHELGEHQLAMIAGIREGFQKMMDRFDPLTLEKLFKRRGKYSSIPGLRQARCWMNYSDYYAGFSDNMDSSFQNLFGTDFVQAYEDHLRRLSASRKKQTQNQVEREK